MGTVADSDLELYRRIAREFGKLGGRPREVPHSEGEYCLCCDCRRQRARKHEASGPGPAAE